MSIHTSFSKDDRRWSKKWFARAFGTAAVVLLSTVSAKAGAVVGEKFATGPSINPSVDQRVATIRAQVQELAEEQPSAPLAKEFMRSQDQFAQGET